MYLVLPPIPFVGEVFVRVFGNGIIAIALFTPVLAILLGIYALFDIEAARLLRLQRSVASLGIVMGLVMLFIVLPSRLVPHPPIGRICLQNLKVQANALLIYADDNSGRWPQSAAWGRVVRHYSVDKHSSSHDSQLPQRLLTYPALPRGQVGGYAFNSALGAAARPTGKPAVATVMVFESKAGLGLYGGREMLLREPRHYDGVNLAFADGHVKWMKEALTGKLTWDLPQTEERR